MSNPVLSENKIREYVNIGSEPMSINGVVNKSLILLACVLLTSTYTWMLFAQGFMDKVMLLQWVGIIGGLISFVVIMFNRKLISIMAPAYALFQGLFLGGITAFFEKVYPGIAIQAVGATFMALFAMLFLYRIGAIRCTEKFRSIIMVSMFSILGIYIINLIGSFFGMQVPQLFTSSLIGIGFSAFVVVIAALNLIIDFDFIEQSQNAMLDKSFEWYGAFSLMVTLVWLYIEILNLLAKLRNK